MSLQAPRVVSRALKATFQAAQAPSVSHHPNSRAVCKADCEGVGQTVMVCPALR
jgi:hypothetical protein